MRVPDAIRCRHVARTPRAGRRRRPRPAAARTFAANGLTPTSPKQGDAVPAGKRTTFKVRVEGP
jgi:hypothetical protein